MAKQYIAINWNAIEDEVDKATWEKLTEQFWLDTGFRCPTTWTTGDLSIMTSNGLSATCSVA